MQVSHILCRKRQEMMRMMMMMIVCELGSVAPVMWEHRGGRTAVPAKVCNMI